MLTEGSGGDDSKIDKDSEDDQLGIVKERNIFRNRALIKKTDGFKDLINTDKYVVILGKGQVSVTYNYFKIVKRQKSGKR